jgi:hypothetical protein
MQTRVLIPGLESDDDVRQRTFAALSRFCLANQRIGFLLFAACADSQVRAMNNASASWFLPIPVIAAKRTGRAPSL